MIDLGADGLFVFRRSSISQGFSGKDYAMGIFQGFMLRGLLRDWGWVCLLLCRPSIFQRYTLLIENMCIVLTGLDRTENN